MIKNLQNDKIKNGLNKRGKRAIMIEIFEILYNNKNPMSISGLWKKSHSRYGTICEIVETNPNIFRVIKIASNRKLVELNRDSKSFDKFLEILNNLRFVEHINISTSIEFS